VAVAIVGGVLLRGLAGVIDIPGMSTGVPSVSDGPGNATGFGDASLVAVEAAYLDKLNELRGQQGYTELSRDGRLDEVATYFNQRRAKAIAGEGTLPPDEELLDLLEGSCSGSPALYSQEISIPPSVTSAQAIGERVASRSYEEGGGSFTADRGSTGLDVHALDENRIVLTQISC
jgi:hypothetical protein